MVFFITATVAEIESFETVQMLPSVPQSPDMHRLSDERRNLDERSPG